MKDGGSDETSYTKNYYFYIFDHKNIHSYMNEMFAVPNEKGTRPEKLRKESLRETACCYRILGRGWG